MKIAKLNIDGYIGQADAFALMFGEEVFSLSKLKSFLDSLDSDITDIHVYINSGGGSVWEGWAIYDKLKASGKKITTIGEGIVGSIATVIFMAGDDRKLHNNTNFFIHNPYVQPDGQPMEGDDLIALGEDLKSEEKKILDFYATQTGSDISKIEQLMSKATSLNADTAIELGFAHSKVDGALNYRKYKLVAFVNKNKKQNNMDNNNEKVIGAIDKLTGMFAKFFKRSFKNMEIEATNGNGDAVKLIIESDTEDLTGKDAFIVDASGNQVPAPDGDYTDMSGKVIKVSAGKVTEVVASSSSEETMNKLKEEIEALKAERDEFKNKLEEKTTEANDAISAMKEVEVEFKALKNLTIGAGANFGGSQQQFPNTGRQTEKNPNQEFLDSVANNIKKKK